MSAEGCVYLKKLILWLGKEIPGHSWVNNYMLFPLRHPRQKFYCSQMVNRFPWVTPVPYTWSHGTRQGQGGKGLCCFSPFSSFSLSSFSCKLDGDFHYQQTCDGHERDKGHWRRVNHPAWTFLNRPWRTILGDLQRIKAFPYPQMGLLLSEELI